MTEKRDDPAAPFERRPELMGAHATPELRFIKRLPENIIGLIQGEKVKVLQQRWKYDDGTCAGWRDVPVVEGWG